MTVDKAGFGERDLIPGHDPYDDEKWDRVGTTATTGFIE